MATITVNDLSNVTDTGTIVTKTIISSATGTAAYSFDGVKDEDLRLVVLNDGATGIVAAYAGDYCEMSKGTLEVVVGGGISKCIVLDQARFRQNDNTMNIGFTFTGSCYAFA